MHFTPNKGIHAREVFSRFGPPKILAFPRIVYKVPDMKKKAAKGAPSESNHRAPMESEYFRDLMSLVEHMALTKYDDGDARETGWITIKTQGSAWMVQVKDPDAGVSFASVGETLDKALATAALLLGCDEAPWEHDQWLMRKMAPKGKKK